MKGPIRLLLEHFGLVRGEAETQERYREADRVADEGMKVAEASRRRRRLMVEVETATARRGQK